MAYTDEDEHQLRIELMAADIESKRVDSDYKRTLRRWEPWKVIIAAVVTTAAAAGYVGFKIGQGPQAPVVVIQQGPGAPPVAPQK